MGCTSVHTPRVWTPVESARCLCACVARASASAGARHRQGTPGCRRLTRHRPASLVCDILLLHVLFISKSTCDMRCRGAEAGAYIRSYGYMNYMIR